MAFYILCALHIICCIMYWHVSWQRFFACTFMLSGLLQHSAKIVSEVCLMEAHSVQHSAAETDTLKFCLLRREL